MGSSETVVAVDVGGTNIRAAVVDRQLNILKQTQIPMDKSGPSSVLRGIGDCVQKVISLSGYISGIGVAMKGFVDHKNGIMVASANLSMKNLHVKTFLEERFTLPTHIDNDVHAATIGEIYYGAGRRFKNFIYINVGTGVAAGLVFERKLYRGAENLSGEFGHTSVNLNGWLCHCGMRGCLEGVVSGPGIVEQARRKIGQNPDSQLAEIIRSGSINATKIFQAADAGDKVGLEVLQDSVIYLGTGIVNLVNLLNPDTVILGGGVFSDADTFIKRLIAFVKTHAIKEAAAHLRDLGVSSLKANEAGLIGAAGLVWEYQDL